MAGECAPVCTRVTSAECGYSHHIPHRCQQENNAKRLFEKSGLPVGFPIDTHALPARSCLGVRVVHSREVEP